MRPPKGKAALRLRSGQAATWAKARRCPGRPPSQTEDVGIRRIKDDTAIVTLPKRITCTTGLRLAAGVPAGIEPAAVLPDENLGCAAGTCGSFAVCFGFEDEVVDDGYVAEVLNLGARKVEPEELSAAGAKFGRALQHIRLILPILLAAAHDNRAGRDELLEGFRVAREPGAPYRVADLEQLIVVCLPDGIRAARTPGRNRIASRTAKLRAIFMIVLR